MLPYSLDGVWVRMAFATWKLLKDSSAIEPDRILDRCDESFNGDGRVGPRIRDGIEARSILGDIDRASSSPIELTIESASDPRTSFDSFAAACKYVSK